jgi:hypothetical protein
MNTSHYPKDLKRNPEGTQDFESDQRRDHQDSEDGQRDVNGRAPPLSGSSCWVSIKKIEPQTTGLITAKTVTMACTVW